MSLEGIVLYFNSKDKYFVILLSRLILYIVEVKVKNVICLECLRYNERGICVYILVVVY